MLSMTMLATTSVNDVLKATKVPGDTEWGGRVAIPMNTSAVASGTQAAMKLVNTAKVRPARVDSRLRVANFSTHTAKARRSAWATRSFGTAPRICTPSPTT